MKKSLLIVKKLIYSVSMIMMMLMGFLQVMWTVSCSQAVSADVWIVPKEKEVPPVEYKLTLEEDDGGAVTSSVKDRTVFEEGEKCFLTAVPNEGYSFSGWTGDVESLSKVISIVFTDNVYLRACFQEIPPDKTYKLTVVDSAGGTVISSEPEKTVFTAGEKCMLTAVPADGYTFVCWAGDVTSEAPSISVTFNDDMNIRACFAEIPAERTYTLTVESETGGSVTSSRNGITTFSSGEKCVLTAVPGNGYAFTGWSGDVESLSKTISLAFNEDIYVRACFERLPEETTCTLNLQTEGSGTVTSSVPGKTVFKTGEKCSLTATPAAGYTFSGWSGDAAGTTRTITVTFDADKYITACFAEIPAERTYTLTVESETGGSVTSSRNGTTTFSTGEKCVLTAVPGSGYAFTGWSGDVESLSKTISLTFNEDIYVRACFERLPEETTYTLNLQTEGSGTVTSSVPGKTVFKTGEKCSLTATPAAGYTFSGWSGDASGTGKTITVTFDADKYITACFAEIPAEKTYTLTVESETGGSVTSSRNGTTTFSTGEKCVLTAVPGNGYAFTGWSGDVESLSKTISLTFNEDIYVRACFERLPEETTYTLNLQTEGSGTVTSSVPGKTVFKAGEKCSLTATPAAGYTFSGWSGDASGTGKTITVTFDADKYITACFAEIPAERTYTLTVESETGGSVTSSRNGTTTFSAGEKCVLTAVPGNGYAFTGWSGDVESLSKTISLTFNEDIYVRACFERLPEETTYTLNLQTEGSGTVTSSVPGKTVFKTGEKCSLTATPAAGYTFSGWSGDASGTGKTITVTFDADKYITACFAEIPAERTYTLTVESETGGSVTSSRNGTTTFSSGEKCVLTAVPGSGYAFTGWSGDVESLSKTISLTFNEDIYVRACFERLPEETTYTLNLQTEGSGTVTSSVSGKTVFKAGEKCSLTATPAAGYTFSGWSGDASGTGKTITVTFDADMYIQASFSQLPAERTYTLTASSIGNGRLEITPNKTAYYENETVKIRAVPDEGFQFTGWNNGSHDKELNITMNGDVTLSAGFVKRNWTVVVYMAADNDLEAAAILDMNEMEAANFEDKGISVLALVDRAEGYDGTNGNWTDTRLYEIHHDVGGLNGTIVSERLDCVTLGLAKDSCSELNMSDPNVLYGVLNYAQNEYKADNYGLIIWGHGTGWRSGGDYSDNPLSEYEGGRAVAIDDYSSSYMTISQVHNAFSRLKTKLAFIGMDTCFGALMETAWEFRKDATYLVASENIVPSNGWDYETLLNSFAASSLSASAFCDSALDSYKTQYSANSSATISRITLSGVEPLKNKFEDFITVLLNCLQTRADADRLLNHIMNEVVSFSYPGQVGDMFVDMYSLVNSICSSRASIIPGIDPNSGLVSKRDAFVSALNTAVSSKYNEKPMTNRLGIYFVKLTADGRPDSSYSTAYIKNSGDLTQSAFVKDSVNWVPNRTPASTSLIDRLFFIQ